MCLINGYSEKFCKIHRKTHLPQSLFQQFIINKFLRTSFTEHLWTSACRKSSRVSAKLICTEAATGGVLQKRCSQKFRKFYRKTLLFESLFNKVTGLRACNFIKKRLQHSSFPVQLDKFLKTSLLKNICERLFLFIVGLQAYNFHYRNLDKL